MNEFIDFLAFINSQLNGKELIRLVDAHARQLQQRGWRVPSGVHWGERLWAIVPAPTHATNLVKN